ncbi:MAG TPA: L,D-transpeptidase [Ktedonobacterales bacterium]
MSMQKATPLPGARRLQWWLAILAVGLMLFLSACGSLTPKGQQAQQEKAKLDAMLNNAASIGVPAALLTPIRQQEQKVANQAQSPGLFGDSTPDSTYQSIISSYQTLEAQVTTVVNQAAQDARMQAHQDIQTFDQLLQQRQNEGFQEVPAFQARLTQLEQDFDKAQTPTDFQQISATANQQTEALQLMMSTYQDLQGLQDSLNRMKDAGLDITLGQQEYNDDLTKFRAAATPQDFKKLQITIAAQTDQLAADQVSAIPAIGAAMLNQYQQLITQAQQYGEDVTQDQQQLAQDQQDLKNANTISAYLELSTRIRGQIDAAQVLVVRGKARLDLQKLQTMIGQTNINNDYEYQDADDAYAVEQQRFDNANSSDDYQTIDSQVSILLTNLQALLTNLNDTTAHDQPHATDLQLIQAYGLTGKVAVVSLTEQTLRLYENGQFVHAIYVVTGQRAAQTPPGLWHIFFKGTNLTFKSSEPKGSPLWYPDTPINYGMEYHPGGYYFHDATWRSYFGPGANLPHNDQTSGQYSNNGSHGCINMSLSNTAYLYSWIEVGTPAIVY